MTAIRVGNAPCSWGVMGGYDASLYPPYAEVLDQIAATGYTGTELGDWGYLPTGGAKLRDELTSRNLMMIGALVPIPLADRACHASGREDALRTARLLAGVAGPGVPQPFIILADANGADPVRVRNAGRIRPEHGLSSEQWQAFTDGANTIASAVRDETGLRTVFHHHCGGYIETPDETARLMEMTDAGLLGLCLDTGHRALGGGDVRQASQQYGDRIWHVHFKEYHAGVAAAMVTNDWDYLEGLANRVFYRLGTGDVDFPGLLADLRARDYDGWIVVEDELPPGMGCPEKSAAADREYLRDLGV
ncbi:MAG: TIM barrel protein [Dehalococcoidia bacterium]